MDKKINSIYSTAICATFLEGLHDACQSTLIGPSSLQAYEKICLEISAELVRRAAKIRAAEADRIAHLVQAKTEAAEAIRRASQS